jgi:hypothetical protein
LSFDKTESETQNLKFLSLEDVNVRKISKYLTTFAKGQNIPTIKLENLSKDISGIWSLWKVGISGNTKTVIIFPMFIHDDGRKLKPTSSHIWDTLLSKNMPIQLDNSTNQNNLETYQSNYDTASSEGQLIFEKMNNQYQINLKNEKEKMNTFFEYQTNLIGKIGLENVRKKRLNDLKNEKRRFESEINKLNEIYPEFNAITMLKIVGTA